MTDRKGRGKAKASSRKTSGIKAKGNSTPPAAPGAVLRVRMYRQGLGDCFLLSLLRPAPARPFHMLIDCGVVLGTPDARGRLRAVVSSVIAETDGHVDVLVVTHEHYDHVSGFLLADDLFAAPDEAGAKDKLDVGEVWFGWTEDPADPVATGLRRERASALSALAGMAMRLGAAAEDEPSLSAALGFFGISSDGRSGTGDTARAMRAAAALAPSGRIRYLRPGDVPESEGAPELRIRVLGPPTDRASLMRTDSSAEVYRVDAGSLETAVRLAIGDDGGSGDPAESPFGAGWGIPLSDIATTDDSRAAFFREVYLATGATDARRKKRSGADDESWRRIDGAWLAGTEALALALDGATNNTSLVLAVEIVATGRVLLFAGDAQVGNWLSWQGLSWPHDQAMVSAEDLMARTIFYKVGHHGSHNATLRARGLELMTAEDLVAFIPVDQAMAETKNWRAMPFPALLSALETRCGDRLVRLDRDPPANAAIVTGGEGGPFGALYVDWMVPF